jgi:hypothetical protein
MSSHERVLIRSVLPSAVSAVSAAAAACRRVRRVAAPVIGIAVGTPGDGVVGPAASRTAFGGRRRPCLLRIGGAVCHRRDLLQYSTG